MGAMRRTVLGILAALLLLFATSCTVTVKDPDYATPEALPPLEQLKQAPVSEPAALASTGGVLAFVTADRNIVCALTAAKGENLNLPYEPNSFADPANAKFATVPVAHCELAVYPEPEARDIEDDCAGTGLGYLGGTALLTPDKAVYGECRSGVTGMEAEFGPKGSRAGPISQLPVLEDGQNVERNGLRCSAYSGGVACGNVSAGVAFFVSRTNYQLVEAPEPAESPGNTPTSALPTASNSA